MKIVKTGIEPLDMFLKGGLPAGSTILLVAPTGSGAEIFAKQFAAGGPKDEKLFVTTDESTEEVMEAAKEHGWHIEDATIVDLRTDFADAVLNSRKAKKQGFDARSLVENTTSTDLLKRKTKGENHIGELGTDYLARLLDPMTSQNPPDRVVIDSLDFFLNLYEMEDVVATLSAVKASHAKEEDLMLWVLSKGAHETRTERRLELMADCLIELEVIRKGTSFERYFMVKKVKNHTDRVGVSTYEVTRDGFRLEVLERIV